MLHIEKVQNRLYIQADESLKANVLIRPLSFHKREFSRPKWGQTTELFTEIFQIPEKRRNSYRDKIRCFHTYTSSSCHPHCGQIERECTSSVYRTCIASCAPVTPVATGTRSQSHVIGDRVLGIRQSTTGYGARNMQRCKERKDLHAILQNGARERLWKFVKILKG